MRAWIDGHLLPTPETPAISVVDHGVTVGDGVFETMKVVDGLPFALERHLARLERSARGLGLTPPPREDVVTGIRAVLEAEPLPLGRVRVTVTGGPSPLGSNRGDAGPTLAVAAGPVAPSPATTAVVTVPWTRNERSAVAGLKTTSYAENVVALARAAEHGASEALFANTVGELCEGTGSNVFYVLDGELRTPTLASGCLAGVTRALVLEWFGGREVDAPLTVLDRAEEVLLVSSLRDVQGVHRLDDRDLPAPGPVTRAAAAAWRAHESGLLGW